MKKTRQELYALARKLNIRRGGSDYLFDNDNRLDLAQYHGGVSLRWFDGVAGHYRKHYLKGALLVP